MTYVSALTKLFEVLIVKLIEVLGMGQYEAMQSPCLKRLISKQMAGLICPLTSRDPKLHLIIDIQLGKL